eukprot:s1246_g5.t1
MLPVLAPEVHAATVAEACKEAGVTMAQVPGNIFVALIQRRAKESAAQTVDGQTSWNHFLDIIVPWPLEADGGDDPVRYLTLQEPKVRFLNKSPPELVRLAERTVSEKFTTFIRSGAASKDAIISLSVECLAHFYPESGPASEQVVAIFPVPAGSDPLFSTFKHELLSIASAMLAITAHGNPGEFDGSFVKKLVAQHKTDPNGMSGLIYTALTSSNYWQASGSILGLVLTLEVQSPKSKSKVGIRIQEALKTFFSFVYAEQAAGKEFQQLMRDLSDPLKHKLDSAKSALQRLALWKETLRPGQAQKLEAKLHNCFEAWTKEILPPEESEGNANGEDTAAENLDLEGRSKLNAQEFFAVLSGAPAAALPNFYNEVARMAKDVQGFAKKEAQNDVIAKLDKACLELKEEEEVTAKSLDAFIDICRQSQGLFFSEQRVKTEDWAMSPLMSLLQDRDLIVRLIVLSSVQLLTASVTASNEAVRQEELNGIFKKVSLSIPQLKGKAASVLLLLANHSNEADHRSHLLKVAGFHKNFMDMEHATGTVSQCGSCAETRSKNASFQKAESFLMSTLARWKKMQFPVASENAEGEEEESGALSLKVDPEKVEQAKELAARAQALIDEQRVFVVEAFVSQLKSALGGLKPLAGGLPNGKSWKADVEASVAYGFWQHRACMSVTCDIHHSVCADLVTLLILESEAWPTHTRLGLGPWQDPVTYGTSSWLPQFQKIEKDLTEKYKVVKKLHGDGSAAVSRYGADAPPELQEAKTVMDQVLITCSEGLLLRALNTPNPDARKAEVRQHMQRMADQKVGQVSEKLLAACQKAMAA